MKAVYLSERRRISNGRKNRAYFRRKLYGEGVSAAVIFAVWIEAANESERGRSFSSLKVLPRGFLGPSPSIGLMNVYGGVLGQ